MLQKTFMTQAGSSTETDRRFMNAALRLARKHQGMTLTNPSVGCVIVKDLGHGPVIVGSAVTAVGGRPHAEPPALEEAEANAAGATAYVTLEPCAHHGKTPPCAQALINAGVARVVTAITDPDSRVNGQGHQMLIDAGIEVTTMDGGEFATRVMQGYLKARSGFLPFVTLKLAMDKDGVMGQQGKGNFRISCDGGFRQTHLARARHHAILVGAGTLTSDNPSLTCRLPGLEDRSPVRIVLDDKFQISAEHNVLKDADSVQTWIVAPPSPPAEWLNLVKGHNAQHLVCEIDEGRIALPELLQDLAARGIQSVMVEGGARIAESFIEEDLVDEIIVHLGEKPDELDDPVKAINAPFKPDRLPEGYSLLQTLQFGADTSLRLGREH